MRLPSCASLFPVACTLALVGCASAPSKPAVPLPAQPMGIGNVQISAVTNDPERETGLRVSPDGRYMLFNTEPGVARQASNGFLDMLRLPTGQRVVTPASGYTGVSIAMLELGKPGKSIVSQIGARDPSWLADSKRFVYSMLQGSQALLARSAVGDQTAAVGFLSPSPCVAYDQQPSVAPDGKTLLFVTATAEQPAMIATMDLQSPSAKCKILFPGSAPQWNPSGRSFVFQRVLNGYWQLFVFTEGQNLLTQITFGAYDNAHASWSPDGKRLVFMRTISGDGDIYTIGVDGSELTQITRGATHDHHPVWAKDGRLFFVSNAGGQEDIWQAVVPGK